MSYIKLNFKSKALMRSVTCHVFLPHNEERASAKAPYKTLYFLPGFSSDGFEMMTGIAFRPKVEREGIAVVIPDCENSYYIDKPDRLELQSQYIGEELVQITRELLPLSDKKEDTFIGGISMGGYGALYNGMRYSDTFSKILAMSPGLNIYKNPQFRFELPYLNSMFGSEERYYSEGYDPEKVILAAKADGIEIPELYLCCGKQDELVYDVNKKMAETLKNHGVSLLYREDDGKHDVDFWHEYLNEGFGFLNGVIPEDLI